MNPFPCHIANPKNVPATADSTIQLASMSTLSVPTMASNVSIAQELSDAL
jgi:hypothetical protein